MSEQNNNTPPAPVEKTKTDWRDGKHPLSVRVRDKAVVEFLDKLITEKGNQQSALYWCIGLAMNGASTGNAGDLVVATKALHAAQDENIDLKQQLVASSKALKTKDEEIARLRTTPAAGIQLTDGDLQLLSKVEKAKKLTRDKALSYTINYTHKNDWL